MPDLSTVAQAFDALPDCAVSCLLNGFVTAGCDASNVRTCYCPNVSLQYNISTCTQIHCNVTEQAIASNSHQITCAGVPIESRVNYLFISLTVISVLLYITAGLRFFIRWRIAKRFWWDDWTMMIATALSITSSAVGYTLIEKGLGKHIWDVNYKNFTCLDKLYFVTNVLYIVHLLAVKCSILFLYLRIFRDTSLRRWCWATQIFLAINAIIFFFCLVFRCTPWDEPWKTLPGLNAQCLSFEKLALAGAGFSIAEDIWILLLPIPQLLQLDLNRKKKIQLILMFNIGIFACIASLIRLRYVVEYNPHSTDPTYENASITFWSTLEIGVAYLCANLPLIRPLLRVIAPGIFGWSHPEDYISTTIHSSRPVDQHSAGFSQLDEAQRGDVSFSPEPMALENMGRSEPHNIDHKPDAWPLEDTARPEPHDVERKPDSWPLPS